MAYLLDTHAFLWFVAGDKQLPKRASEIIKKIDEPCFISLASLWEITIKIQLKKLELGLSLKELFAFIEKNQIGVVSIHTEHLLMLSKLPKVHSDPFDRLIISQAICDDFIIISKDKYFSKYKVQVFWK